MRVFRSEFGAILDRIGHEDGSCLYPLIDAKPQSFEARSLPVSALELPYFSYRVADEWPEGMAGWKVQSSTAAPWFGRQGGATQILFFDEEDSLISVEDLLKMGVLANES
ncbi:TNT domain-containing protein [Paenarthrobacter sp. NPDC056912]|uniref:TNT domain-containing protein n=1 Tax=Paenarthrobacter sp. NPDC056912 TaxID=3345965 RepID=UPI003670B919